MPRKPLKKLLGDMGEYITGSAYIPRDAPKDGDWPYPLNCLFMLDDPTAYFEPRDGDGVPMKNFANSIGVHYLPSRVAAYGFACWQAWKAGDTTRKDDFFKAADWFVAHEDGLFLHHFSLTSVGLEAPWLSCIAQGEGISVLARAYVETGAEHYRDVAVAALAPLTRPVADGGVFSKLPNGAYFLEEYPGTTHRHVLNGCLYAMVGLHDLDRIAPESGAGALLQELLKTVALNADAWERGGWSLYQYAPRGSGLAMNYNTPGYQNVHIALLSFLAAERDTEGLGRVADRLSRAAESLPRRLIALGGKVAYRARAGW
ncbi:D-glucuronyl C5-epimerase family protein [Roseovarius sp. E0-M6]|uniref:D-glucuronyl C5-epimerase family protein n=1 Tax=Roseovarius sp. E0-M6 TaxID=3127118 RepID=UPI00301055F3